MKVTTEGEKLYLKLPSECTIAKVKTDFEKIQNIFSQYFKEIELDAASVEEIDTAYFQMLLSLKSTALKHSVVLKIETSSEIRRVCELYGITNFK